MRFFSSDGLSAWLTIACIVITVAVWAWALGMLLVRLR